MDLPSPLSATGRRGPGSSLHLLRSRDAFVNGMGFEKSPISHHRIRSSPDLFFHWAFAVPVWSRFVGPNVFLETKAASWGSLSGRSQRDRPLRRIRWDANLSRYRR